MSDRFNLSFDALLHPVIFVIVRARHLLYISKTTLYTQLYVPKVKLAFGWFKTSAMEVAVGGLIPTFRCVKFLVISDPWDVIWTDIECFRTLKKIWV